MRDALAEALAKLSIFEASSDAVVAFGASDLGILTCNPAVEVQFGYRARDLYGQPVEILFAADRRASAPPPDGGFPPRVFEGKPVELLGRRAQGDLFPVEVLVTKVAEADAAFFVASIRDILQRRRAEEALRESEAKLRSAIEALGEGLLITDQEDRIAYVNARMAHIAEYPPEQMLGKTVEALLIPPEEVETYRERAELRRQGISEEFDILMRRKGGDRFWAEVNATPFRNRRGLIIGGLAAVMDVTERKQIQEELVAAVDAAEDASRAKSAFLANMSHELRTPLNAIIGYSEMLREELVHGGLAELLPDLEKIHASGKHLLALINDILDLSKIEAGTMDLLLEDLDVSALVHEAADSVEAAAAERGNTLTVDCPPDIGAMQTDGTRVRQVLLNHLSNAVKFTENGQVHLEVRPAALSGRPGVRFAIRDNGIGIAADKLDELFQPFTQADTSATRKFGGSGLGLVISRQLCHKMGGDVSVETELGKGSTFTILLPRESVGTSWDRPVSPPPVRRSVPAQGPSTALVIDDDPLVRDLLKRFLTKEGFRVATAQNGAEGLEAARRVKPVLVTLDVIMPGMDGWATLKAFKEAPELADIPVIMMTIIDNPKLGFSLGASDYVTKPIDWRRLGATLARFRQEPAPPTP